MPFDFTVTDVIPAEPKAIYEAWLDSRGHAKMTGDRPASVSADEGRWFAALRGFVVGKNLSLEPGRRIVQSLRTREFLESDPDSRIEVLLEPVAGGTKVTIHHTNVPDQLGRHRDAGWQDNYFQPMRRYFGG